MSEEGKKIFIIKVDNILCVWKENRSLCGRQCQKKLWKTTRVGKFDKVCATYFINNWLIQVLTIWGTIKYQGDHRSENIYKLTFREYSLQWELRIKKYKKLIFQENSTPCTAPLFSMKIIILSTIYLMIQHMIQVLSIKSEGYFRSLEDLWWDHHNKEWEYLKVM